MNFFKYISTDRIESIIVIIILAISSLLAIAYESLILTVMICGFHLSVILIYRILNWYQILNSFLMWTYLFKILPQVRDKNDDIEDYTDFPYDYEN
jgi:hypothetical protein